MKPVCMARAARKMATSTGGSRSDLYLRLAELRYDLPAFVAHVLAHFVSQQFAGPLHVEAKPELIVLRLLVAKLAHDVVEQRILPTKDFRFHVFVVFFLSPRPQVSAKKRKSLPADGETFEYQYKYVLNY